VKEGRKSGTSIVISIKMWIMILNRKFRDSEAGIHSKMIIISMRTLWKKLD
jgi:hypothetical protein